MEVFWKALKSIFKIQAMQLPGDGLYTGLLIKVLAYLLVIWVKTQRAFSKFSLVQLMRKIHREEDGCTPGKMAKRKESKRGLWFCLSPSSLDGGSERA